MRGLSWMKVFVLMNWIALNGGYGTVPLDVPLDKDNEGELGNFFDEIEEEEEDLSDTDSFKKQATTFQDLLNEEARSFSEVFAIAKASLSHIAQLKELLGDSFISNGGPVIQEMQQITDLMCSKFQELKALESDYGNPSSIAVQVQHLMKKNKQLVVTVQDLQKKLSEKDRELKAYKKNLEEIDKNTMIENTEQLKKSEYKMFGQNLMNPLTDEDSDSV